MFLTIDHVTKRFGDKTVLQDVHLQVERGQFVALLGPSGCGKTTLLNALAGLVDLDGGRIEIDGRVLSTRGHTVIPEQRQVGMVFQDFALWPHMTVFDNVAFGLKIRRDPRATIRERVEQVLATVQMQGFETRYPHQLSGGQKQRVAIARALAPAPTVLLLDEPLSSLDAKLREEMRWELLSIIQQAGTTAVYVTHDQVEALSMADHVVVMHQGRVEQQGAPTAIYQHPETVFTAAFLGASNLFRGQVSERGVGEVTVECSGFSVRATAGKATGGEATVAVRPSDIELILGDAEPPVRDGTWLSATVRQRAFHGMSWQYRLETDGPIPQRIEVWHAGQVATGSRVSLFLPLEACRTVAESPLEREVTVAAQA
ncbi:MAG: ABC transporter ATP-binding protein [Firmicutes bacterium]|nr:ABC transporter ATP-binding protein [Bacillota bacterium]